jgi:hypothetical protein
LDTKSEICFPSLNIQNIADKYKTYIRQICENKKQKQNRSVYCKHRHYGSLPDAAIWWCLRTGGGGVLTRVGDEEDEGVEEGGESFYS